MPSDYLFGRRSLKLPIILAVILIVLVVLLTIGWVVLSIFAAFASPLNWILLAVGAVFLAVVLIGVVTYFSLTVKAINLTRRQSNFMDSVSHELKSPIASLKLYLQTLSLRDVTHQQREEFYRFMLDDIHRLDGLINHLLDAARLDRPNSSEPQEWIDVMSLIERCADELATRYQLDRSRIKVNGPSGMVRARAVDLEMIFRNLIDNAIKYGGSPAEVEVHSHWLHQKKTLLVVEVSDNGPGIPHHQRRKIFKRFERLGVELERTKPGTGLGLYIVGTQVRRLKGTVRVSHSPRRQGTSFEVSLPAEKPSPPANATRSAEDKARPHRDSSPVSAPTQ